MSGLFGGGSNTPQQEVYAGIQVSTSTLGGCIPYVAGRQRVPFNLMWYGNFKVTTSNGSGGKGGGGGGSKQYSYSAAFIAGLCIGPIQGVHQIWHDKALVTLTSEGLALSEGGASFIASISGTSMVVTKMLGGFISNGASVTGPGVTAGTVITASPGGGIGTYTVNNSQTVAAENLRSSQPIWSGYPAGTPTVQQIPYDSNAYLATSSYVLGSSAEMPNLNIEVEGVVPGYSDANSIFDADPSAVIPDYILDPVHGALAGFPGTPLVIGSSAAPLTGATDSYQSYVMSVGLLTSPYEDTQRQATDFISELLQCTNSNCRLSVGTLEIIPYCGSAVSATVAGTAFSYTPNLTPEYQFTDDDFLSEKNELPIKGTRVPQSDTYNMVNVEYLDRSNYYNTAPVNCSDLNDIGKYGVRLATNLTWHQICQGAVAKTAGQLWLQLQLYERNTYTFKVRADYCLLEALDYIALNEAATGMVGQVCQITQIEDDEENVLTLTVRELIGVSRNTEQFNWASAAGYFANQATDPGVVSAPAIFAMPPIPGSLSEGITLGIAVAGLTSNAAWLGCVVFCSADGGTTYQAVGTIPEACLYGTLSANLGAVADPDTTSTLSIALANTNLQFPTSATHAEADAAQTIVLVGSGSTAEVMSYGASGLISAGNYNLSYLRRNQFGSTNQAHSSGAPFVRIDGSVFQLPVDPGSAGQTLYFKFVSYNLWGQFGPQTLASSTAYSYTVPQALPVGGIATLTPRGFCAITGQTVYKATTAGPAWDSDARSAAPTASLSISGQYNSGGALGIGFVTPAGIGSPIDPTNAEFYGFYPHADASLTAVMDGGTTVWTGPPPAKNDLYQVTYDGFTIRYYLNGSLVTSAQHQGLQFYAYITLFSSGAQFSNVETTVGTLATPAQWVCTNDSIVNDTNVMKVSGASNWVSAAWSVIPYPTCHVTAKINQSSAIVMLGLSSVPVPTAANIAGNSVYAQADHALYSDGAGGAWAIYRSGTLIATTSIISAPTDVATITYDGTTVTYFVNGASVGTFSTSGQIFYGFVALYAVGSANGLNSLRFGPTTNLAVQDTAQIGVNAATAVSTVFVASAAAGSTPFVSIVMASLSVGPFAFDTMVVITTTAQWDNTSTVKATNLTYGNSTTSTGYSSQIQQYVPVATAIGDSTGIMAQENTYALPAGTTQIYYFNAHAAAGPAIGVGVLNINLKAEAIKR